MRSQSLDITSSASANGAYFFESATRERHIPSEHARSAPGLPHHRQRHHDDPIYLAIFWAVLIVSALYTGWHYLVNL